LVPRDFIEQFRRQYPFAVDPFQREAIGSLDNGESVLVSAPTGAGKTLIAEFAIDRAFRSGSRVIYTTPLKALSNQKYSDFCRQYGSDVTGILTGDVKINGGARLVVMTTEILRNLLARDSLGTGIGAIVLDECHFIGDEGRGTVWEEIVIHSPREIQLVALSATVGNVEEIAEWIRSVHGPIQTVSVLTRPVPLHYFSCDLKGAVQSLNEADRQRWELRGADRVAQARRPPRRIYVRPRDLIVTLQEKQWLPAIYFIFSREGCEQALQDFVWESLSLVDTGLKSRANEEIKRFLRESGNGISGSSLSELALEGLRRGVGLHHAGVLPSLKRLTERLFEIGLVQVVFSTETMSLGIHMPAKSVVIQGLRKRTDAGFRSLTHNELTQMAGRAGRRGIDPEGNCILALDRMTQPELALRIVRKPSEPIQSQFKIGYASAASLIERVEDPELMREMVERSLGQYQNRAQIKAMIRDLEKAHGETERLDASGFSCCLEEELIGYREARDFLDEKRHQAKLESRGKRKKESTVERMALALSRQRCHRCPHRGKREHILSRLRRVKNRLEQGKTQLETLRSSYWREFERVNDVLQHFGYVREGSIEPEGKIVAALRHDNELFLARALLSTAFRGASPTESALLVSCLIEEPRQFDPTISRRFLRRRPDLRKRIHSIEEVAKEIKVVQDAHGVQIPVSFQIQFVPSVYYWARGEENWVRLVQDNYGGHEGDVIRAFRRLIDLCRQVTEIELVPESLRSTMSEAAYLLDRGIVFECALV
jgi:ATP-dependent RNA helicase HelY